LIVGLFLDEAKIIQDLIEYLHRTDLANDYLSFCMIYFFKSWFPKRQVL
jgi:hypothetical protein